MSTYDIWAAMKKRCLNPTSDSYKWYGAKGITVCSRWMLYENFVADMGEAPENHSIERKDNSKDYSKDNCYWLPTNEQYKNRRSPGRSVGATGIKYVSFERQINRYSVRKNGKRYGTFATLEAAASAAKELS